MQGFTCKPEHNLNVYLMQLKHCKTNYTEFIKVNRRRNIIHISGTLSAFLKRNSPKIHDKRHLGDVNNACNCSFYRKICNPIKSRNLIANYGYIRAVYIVYALCKTAFHFPNAFVSCRH